jgi:hypothetical protein
MTLDVHVVDHPLVAQKLTRLRDATTPSPQFRRLVDELTTLLGYEATRELPTVAISVVTPLAAAAAGTGPAGPPPLVVPVLRAGVGMLDAMIRLIPEAEVGFVGLARDETTLAPVVYAERLPADLTGRQVYVVDPMLPSGRCAAPRRCARCACSPHPKVLPGCGGTSRSLRFRSGWFWPPWTTSSTTAATSSRVWVTPETGSSVSSKPAVDP